MWQSAPQMWCEVWRRFLPRSSDDDEASLAAFRPALSSRRRLCGRICLRPSARHLRRNVCKSSNGGGGGGGGRVRCDDVVERRSSGSPPLRRPAAAVAALIGYGGSESIRAFPSHPAAAKAPAAGRNRSASPVRRGSLEDSALHRWTLDGRAGARRSSYGNVAGRLAGRAAAAVIGRGGHTESESCDGVPNRADSKSESAESRRASSSGEDGAGGLAPAVCGAAAAVLASDADDEGRLLNNQRPITSQVAGSWRLRRASLTSVYLGRGIEGASGRTSDSDLDNEGRSLIHNSRQLAVAQELSPCHLRRLHDYRFPRQKRRRPFLQGHPNE